MSDDTNKLFVAGLPDTVTEDVLRDLFTDAGVQVVEVSLPRDRATGRPRGFAFVRLGGPDEVDRALARLNGHLIGTTSISVRRFNAERPARGERPAGGPGGPGGPGGGGGGGGGGERRGPPQDTSDRTLFVGNLPYDATQDEIETLLRERGADAVLRVHLPLDPDGRRRGFGFVTLGSPEAARVVVDQLRGVALRGRTLVVNLAQPRPAGGAGGGPGGPRGERSFGPPGGGPGGPNPAGPPPPASRFGAPAKPGGKADYGRKRKTEGEGGPGRSARGARRENEERWRDVDDDE